MLIRLDPYQGEHGIVGPKHFLVQLKFSLAYQHPMNGRAREQGIGQQIPKISEKLQISVFNKMF